METKRRFSLLIQVGSDNMIFDRNRPETWRIYGEELSFRSVISGHVLVIDSDFYEQLPLHLRPLPCVRTIIVANHKKYYPQEPAYEIAGNLKTALFDIEIEPGKKKYLVGKPSSYLQSMKLYSDLVDEIIVLRIGASSRSGFYFMPSEKIWRKKTLSMIPQDAIQPTTLEFIQFNKIA